MLNKQMQMKMSFVHNEGKSEERYFEDDKEDK